jgi:hypothetical protein
MCPLVGSREGRFEGCSVHLSRDRVEMKLILIHTKNFVFMFHYFLSPLAPLFILLSLRAWIRR